MILVDRRQGSAELFPALSRKVPATLDTLAAGDFAFEGFTEAGRGLIGVERKQVSDALDCMLTGRFAGYQLIEMVNLFEYLHLVIEGLYRPNPASGLMEVWIRGQWVPSRKGSRTFMYKDFSHFLMTLAYKTPVKVWRTSNPSETVQLVADLFGWHNEKAWDKHTSHLQINNAAKPGQRVTFRKPSLRRRIACELPGIGWDRSKAVEEKFATTEDMICATKSEWMDVDGIGDGIAGKVVAAIRGE